MLNICNFLQLDAALRGMRGDSEDSSDGFVVSTGRLVMQQNAELRGRLEDERVKVRSHMDTQRQQARIVQKLQAKVRCYCKNRTYHHFPSVSLRQKSG